jgi:hypothetical protein
MTGVGHLIRKETDLLSILAHKKDVFVFETSKKNLMITEKIKYRVLYLKRSLFHTHMRSHDKISKKTS